MKGLKQEYLSRVTKEKSAFRGQWERAVESNWTAFKRRLLRFSVTEKHQKTGAVTDKRDIRLLLQRRKHGLTEKKPSKGSGLRRESPSGIKDGSVVRLLAPSRVSKITSVDREADSATNVCSDTLRLMGSPINVEEKLWERISSLTEAFYTIGLLVPRYRTSEKAFS